MTSTRLLTLNPDHEPLWVRLYVHEVGEAWAAMLVAERVVPPGPGVVKGISFFADTLEEAERVTKAYLGQGEAAN